MNHLILPLICLYSYERFFCLFVCFLMSMLKKRNNIYKENHIKKWFEKQTASLIHCNYFICIYSKSSLFKGSLLLYSQGILQSFHWSNQQGNTKLNIYDFQYTSFGFMHAQREEDMATHCTVLVWRIPWTDGPGRLQAMEWQAVRHN